MLAATQMMFDSLEKWLAAVRDDDFAAVRRHAEHLTMAGQMLVLHPDFVSAFRSHCPDTDPQSALIHLCEFLVCATDGRADHLKRWLNESQSRTD